jgi:hypothetical protein
VPAKTRGDQVGSRKTCYIADVPRVIVQPSETLAKYALMEVKTGGDTTTLLRSQAGCHLRMIEKLKRSLSGIRPRPTMELIGSGKILVDPKEREILLYPQKYLRYTGPGNLLELLREKYAGFEIMESPEYGSNMDD